VAAALGARAYREWDLRQAALPELEALRAATRETSTLSELLGDRRAYISQLLSPQEVHMAVDVGMPYPLHAGSSGKAILAFLHVTDQDRVLSGLLRRATENTITDVGVLRAQLEVITANGYAVSRGERLPDAASVAAPIFDIDRRVIGSLSVCGPIRRFAASLIPEYGALVRDAALRVSSTMGFASDA
jgi:DNA-binding IclR family transcriptional regulator